MKYRLLNYIACPYCKDEGFPLKLIVIEERLYEERKIPEDMKRPLCDLYCGFKKQRIESGVEYPCDECIKHEVVTGVLVCPKCNRWYPIIDEIPRLLPDEYRKKEEDIAFLERYSSELPDDIKYGGKPHNLSQR